MRQTKSFLKLLVDISTNRIVLDRSILDKWTKRMENLPEDITVEKYEKMLEEMEGDIIKNSIPNPNIPNPDRG